MGDNAKDFFEKAFDEAGRDPILAKTHYYRGLSRLADDIKEIIVLLQDIKDATQTALQ